MCGLSRTFGEGKLMRVRVPGSAPDRNALDGHRHRLAALRAVPRGRYGLAFPGITKIAGEPRGYESVSCVEGSFSEVRLEGVLGRSGGRFRLEHRVVGHRLHVAREPFVAPVARPLEGALARSYGRCHKGACRANALGYRIGALAR